MNLYVLVLIEAYINAYLPKSLNARIPSSMIQHTSTIKVRYQETDAMGIVYHANYLSWFEVARIDLLDSVGCSYKSLEEKGYLLPVLEINAKYLAPAGFDEELTVEATISEMPRVKIRIEYRVLRGEQLLTTGYSVHAFMDRAGFPVKPADEFLEILKEHF